METSATDMPGIYLNSSARHPSYSPAITTPAVEAFHRRLPQYNQTPLASLPDVAKELGVRHVLVKDESQRFGLPAFKILGASWAVYRAVAAKVGLPPTVSLEDLGIAANANQVQLVTCSDGNWGRAVARMGKYLGIPAKVFVPKNIDEATQNNIKSEGAQVPVVQGDYDASIRAAMDEAERSSGLLVMDTSWSGYEEIPRWVVEGYSTMLTEADRQVAELAGKAATHAIASVGVGSWAQAVTAHFKSKQPPATIITVEPTAAACLKTSLEAGVITPIETGDTIMCGMNCGTVSSIAWPVLRDGVNATVTVTDKESHEAVQALHAGGVNGGPCGAAPLAALRKLCKEKVLGLGPESVVVLFCTEGARPYPTPA